MVKALRFLAAVALLVWLGCLLTLTFYVAPSLFSNQSGVVPNSSVAGDIIAPLLHKMYRTGWIALPAAFCLLCAVYAMAGRGGRAIAAACAMLALAWTSEIYAGLRIEPQIHSIREELRRDFGGYHLAPASDPRRARFGRLHGLSMSLVMADLALGLGALFCATQLAPTDRAERHGAAA